LLILTEIVEELGCSVVGMQTAIKAIDWLSSNKPHLMVLDYTLPDSSGNELINRLKEKGVEVPPFIVSTGHGDEHIAVEMMKLGARDYVVKDSTFINRISIVVDRVIREIENENKLKEAELSLIEANQFGLQIIENVQEGIVVYDIDLKYKLWNPFMAELTGYTSDEVIGKYPWDIFPFLDSSGVLDNLRRALNGENVKEIDFEFFISKNGRSGWASDRTTQLYNSKGELIGLIATIRDITERKKAEMEALDSERQIRMITNNIPSFISYVDNQLFYRYVNENYERLSGFKSHEIIGKHIREVLGEEYMVSNLENIQKVLGGEKVYYENAIETKMGENLYVYVSCIPHFDDKGKVAGYYVFSNDITERKRAEEEIIKAKEKAETNELKLKDAQEIAKLGSWELDIENGIFTFTDSFYKIFHTTAEEMGGYKMSIEEYAQRFVHPVDAFIVSEETKKAIDTTDPNFSKYIEHRILYKDGGEGFIAVRVFVQKDKFGKTIKTYGVNQDITDRKIAENELRIAKEKVEKNEQRLIDAQSVAKIGSWETNLVSMEVHWSEETYKIFELEKEMFKNSHPSFLAYVHPSDIERIEDVFAKSFSTKHYNSVQHRIITPSGKLKHVEERWIVSHDENDKPIKASGTCQDITEKKLIELELIAAKERVEKSENRFQKVAESADEWFWEIDTNGLYTYSNSVVEKILEYSIDEIVGKKYFFDFFNPDDKEDLKAKAFEIINNHVVFKDFTNLNISKNGKKVVIRSSGSPILNDLGELIGYRGVDADITKEKQMEIALKESEEKFRLSFKTSPDSININTFEGKYVEINDGFTLLTGYTEEEVIGKSSLEIKIWENPRDREQLIEGLLKDGYVKNLEALFRMKDGSIKTALMSARIISINNEPHIISISRDITERKKFEDSLKTLTWAVEQSPASIVITDMVGRIEYVNRKFTEVTGYSANEAIGLNPKILKSGHTSKEEYKQLWNTILAGNDWSGVFCNVKRNGDKYWENALISTISNEKGEIVHFVAVKEDITEKRDLERKTLSYIVEAEERERNRFSRELHDGLGPILSTIKLFFQWLHQTDDNSKRDMIFENGISNLNEAIDTIREISNNLSPRTITTFGVNAALKNFISNINQTQKLKINYASNVENRFNKNIEIIVYRIVTELINNTLKYANASQVNINLNEIDGYIKLQYTDDGIGFDYNKSVSQSGQRHRSF